MAENIEDPYIITVEGQKPDLTFVFSRYGEEQHCFCKYSLCEVYQKLAGRDNGFCGAYGRAVSEAYAMLTA